MNLKDEYQQQITDNWDTVVAELRILRRLRTELLVSDQYCKSKEAKEAHLAKIKSHADKIIAGINRQTFLLSGHVNTYEPMRPSLLDSFKGIFNPEHHI